MHKITNDCRLDAIPLALPNKIPLAVPDNRGKVEFLAIPEYGYAVWLTDQLSINVLKGKEPCWLHRKMQEWCFGFRWEKLK